MPVLQWLLPRSLVARVFSLYAFTLLLFVGGGLGAFYQYQFTQQVEDELLAGEMMVNVAAQTVGDSAVIGDYDTINKTLERAISQSNFSKAQFIDANGGVLTASHTVTPPMAAPQWLLDRVQSHLFDINHNIQVGGKDYGVLRLSFAADGIAGEIWRVALVTLVAALVALAVGVAWIRFALKHWLGNFDRVRMREADILAGSIDINALLDADAPAEIRHTFEIIGRAAGHLSTQREEAEITLNTISDGVMRTDAHYRLVYSNPAADQMLGMSAHTLAGQDVQALLPSSVNQ
jgi:PAS domain-containing protein